MASRKSVCLFQKWLSTLHRSRTDFVHKSSARDDSFPMRTHVSRRTDTHPVFLLGSPLEIPFHFDVPHTGSQISFVFSAASCAPFVKPKRPRKNARPAEALSSEQYYFEHTSPRSAGTQHDWRVKRPRSPSTTTTPSARQSRHTAGTLVRELSLSLYAPHTVKSQDRKPERKTEL